MTSEGPQRPGHEPEEAARGAAGPAPHGGHGTMYGRQSVAPFDERDQPQRFEPPGRPAADGPADNGGTGNPAAWAPPPAGRWGVQDSDEAGPASGGWRTPGGAAGTGQERVSPGGGPVPWPPQPAATGRQSQPEGRQGGWSTSGPSAAAWAPSGAPGADWPPETGDRPPQTGNPDVPGRAPEAHPAPPAGPPRWATADLPPAAATDEAAAWAPSDAWGAAQADASGQQPAPEPVAGDYGSRPAAADAGLPQRAQGSEADDLYQSDNGDSLSFGAMSQDSGDLSAVARDQPWPAFAAGGESRQAARDEPQPGGDAFRPGPAREAQPPVYQPAPAPGITPGGAVPLPPQQTRVPGAALAASHAEDVASPPWAAGSADGPAHPEPDGPYDQRPAGISASATPVPQQRSGEPDGGVPGDAPDGDAPGRAVAASAAVPVSSRVTPPSDFTARPESRPSPQSRVYGRPAEPVRESADDAGAVAPVVPAQRAPGVYGRPATYDGNRAEEDADGRFPDPPAARQSDGPGTFPPGSPAAFPPGSPAAFPPGSPAAFSADPPAVFPAEPPAAFPPALPAEYERAAGDQPGTQPFGARPDDRGPHRPVDQTRMGPAFPDDPGFPGDQRFPDDQRFPGDDPRFPGVPGNRPEASNGPMNGAGTGGPANTTAFPPASPGFGGPGTGPGGFGGPGGGPRGFGPDTGPAGSGGPAGFGPPVGFDGPGGFGQPGGPGGPNGGDGSRGRGAAPGVYPGIAPPPPGAPGPGGDPDQARFNSFKPDEQAGPAEEEQAPAPTPQVRNGRVLAAVLVVAVLLLVIPLGAVWLFSGNGKDAYNPAVGDCVKQSGSAPVKATCGESGSYKVTAKQPSEDKCPDANQPHLLVKESGGGQQVLCLKPADK